MTDNTMTKRKSKNDREWPTTHYTEN